jgi:hypothetical protein
MAKSECMPQAQPPFAGGACWLAIAVFPCKVDIHADETFVRYCTASRNVILIDVVSAKVWTGENSECYGHRKLCLVSS